MQAAGRRASLSGWARADCAWPPWGTQNARPVRRYTQWQNWRASVTEFRRKKLVESTKTYASTCGYPGSAPEVSRTAAAAGKRQLQQPCLPGPLEAVGPVFLV